MESNLLIFLFMDPAFSVKIKSSLPNLEPKDFYAFFSNSFVFKFMIHLKLIFI